MKVIFWIGKSGIFGRIVRFLKGSGANHVEIMFSDGMMGTSLIGHGIVLRKREILHKTDWIIIDIPCTDAEEALVRKFFEVDEKGCGYDMKGIVLSQLLPFGIESKNDWFCSEACIAALSRILPFLTKYKPYTVDPSELLYILVAYYKL